MMFRQSVWLGLLILFMAAPVPKERGAKEELERDAGNYIVMKDYCSLDEFEELDYYLFCDTQLHEGAGGFTFKPSIIGCETKTIEEAKELYQAFMERLPLELAGETGEGEIVYVSYVSPDCKWVVTGKWNELRTMRTQMLFHDKEKVKEKVDDAGYYPTDQILIVKNGDGYREMDEEHCEKLSELKKEGSLHEGYSPIWRINAEGSLLAGIRDNYSLLTIRKIEDGTEQWSFSLQGIREEVERIRDDIQEGDTVLAVIQQFEGNEQEGWLTVQAGKSSFFRIAYPSGEVVYLGEYMYSVCFSPDGKYAAYSSDADYDSGVDMTSDEYERMERICPPGICIREIETGKTAYLYWDPTGNPEEDFMEYRDFMWIEKESFEEYMEDDTGDAEDRTLILLDIFQKGILYQEITRDFSNMAEPVSAIISVEMTDSENIQLRYYKGETFTIE